MIYAALVANSAWLNQGFVDSALVAIQHLLEPQPPRLGHSTSTVWNCLPGGFVIEGSVRWETEGTGRSHGNDIN